MIEFSDEQEKLIQNAVYWYHNSSEQIFQFSGGPGTGKSVVLNEIIRRLNLQFNEVATMSYTGAAAIVMRTKGLINSKTIHSTMYEPVSVPMVDKFGNPVLDTYFNTPVMTTVFKPRDLTGIKLFAIDEAGTVPKHIGNDIINTGVKIIACGDLDQLPPVADEPAFLYTGKVYRLTQIMRQASGSAIIYLSQRAKKGLPIHSGLYGDVYVIDESELNDEMLMNSRVILCGKNTTRDKLNKTMRAKLGYDMFKLPQYGERVICRKNNWNIESGGINLTNGLSGTVINHPDVSKFDGKSFKMDFMPDLSNAVFYDVDVDYRYYSSDINIKNEMRSNRSFRYSGNFFEFGYAQTVHLAQGSQWPSGMYFEEYLHPDINNNLNYTALTRFSRSCIYVKKKRKYF